jgi:membrane-bound metal-dependent hydrolase YbcI (DUF457 family)
MMTLPMPSPIGHALGGLVTAWSAERLPSRVGALGRRVSWRLALLAMVVAASPDLDLLVSHAHRRVTHSFVFVALVAILTMAVTRWVTRRIDWWVVGICAGAYASHLLLDWLGADPFVPNGILLLWPFSDRAFISSVSVFRSTMRDPLFDWDVIVTNVKAVTQELVILGPIVYLLWRTRPAMRRYRSRGRSSAPVDLRQPFDGEGDTA